MRLSTPALCAFLPAALLLGGASIPTSIVSAPALVQPSEGEYDELLAEYEAAVKLWEEMMDEASDEERRDLRDNKPAAEFWPLFEGLAAEGDGRARFWLVKKVKEAGVSLRSRPDVLTPLYEALVAENLDESWFNEVLEQMPKDARHLGESRLLELLEQVIAKADAAESRAGALYQAAMNLREREAEVDRERGERYLARIEAELAETTWAKMVRFLRAADATAVGQVAPDFVGKTIDGFEFALSDYRGQVVLLDFYGFW